MATIDLHVQRDSRGRVSLGSVLRDGMYRVSQDAEGRVIFEPAVTLTETELRLISDPGFRSRMTEAAAEAAEPLDLGSL